MAVMPINPVEKSIEGRAQIEAAATSVADLIDAQRIFRKLSGINRLDQT